MKVAEVTYQGPMRTHFYKVQSGKRYKLKAHEAKAVDSIQDAEEFDEQDGFEVSWTVNGELMRHTDGTLESARQMLSDFGYRKKQELAKSLGIKANQSEEDLEEALQEEVDSLQAVAES